MDCRVCRSGSRPPNHECIICKKKVHIIDGCSLPVIGQEEGHSEKRLCHECSRSKYFPFILFFFLASRQIKKIKNFQPTLFL